MRNKQSSFHQNRASVATPSQRSLTDFWEPKTLEQLTAEQGVRSIEHLEDVLGQGAALWRDEADWDAYQAALLESRQKSA